MSRRKSVLTTGEIARICNVAPRTVSKWFDSGQLRGYRIPGSRDRRVPVEQLVRFMRAHDIPTNGLDEGITRILLATGDAETGQSMRTALSRDPTWEVAVAGSVLEVGVALGAVHPRVLVVDMDLPGFVAADLFRSLRDHPELTVRASLALCGTLTDAQRRCLLDDGFADCLVRPFSADDLAGRIAQLLTGAD